MAQQHPEKNDSLEIERMRNEQSRFVHRIEALKAAFPHIKWVVIAALVAWALSSFAGQKTEVLALVEVFFRWDVSKYAGWAAAALAIMWGRRERLLRQGEVREVTQQLKIYEKLMDPHRLSSGLGEDGTPTLRRLEGDRR